LLLLVELPGYRTFSDRFPAPNMHSCTRAHTSVQLSLYCSLHQRYILIPSHQQFNTRTSKRRQKRASSSFWSHEHYETTVAVINQPLMNLAIIKLSFTLLFLILMFLLVVCFSWPLYPSNVPPHCS